MPSFSDTLNILSNLGPINEYPYPYAVTEYCLPEEVYTALAQTRPSWNVLACGRGEENNVRVDAPAFYMLQNKQLHPIWRDFIEYHTSHEFYLQILDRFGPFFREYYPHLDLKNFRTARRYSGEDADIYLDCQIGINTPVKKKSTVSVPHLDSPKELWAGLLYMRDPADNAGGDLVVYKCLDMPKMYSKRLIHDDGLQWVERIPYEANYLACFVNSPFSIHSVTEREITDKPRLLVNFSLEFMKEGEELFDLKRFPCDA